MDGSKSRFKDCLQQSKMIKISAKIPILICPDFGRPFFVHFSVPGNVAWCQDLVG